MSSEVAGQAVALCEGLETSLDISNSRRTQRFLDFARNGKSKDATRSFLEALTVYHDDTPHSAAMNMAIDEALLEHTTVPSIRFYRWHSPALSFGYFGKFADVAGFVTERDLVRRWTGGGIVFHGEDLTYSMVIPASDPIFAESSMSIYEKIHCALRNTLVANGERAELAHAASVVRAGAAKLAKGTGVSEPSSNKDRGYSCFANPVRADVMLNGRKIAGAAQRRTRRGLLHQGSIHNVDFGNGLAKRFAQALSTKSRERKIENDVLKRACELAKRRYGTEDWLRKR
jgi:lipoyl(octanoyl) transferase